MHQGRCLVLDPTMSRSDPKAALADPVKTITLKKGYDYVSVLATSSSLPLRVAAEEVRNTRETDIETSSAKALTAFTTLEAQYLEAVDAWESADASGRVAAAVAVGEIAKQLAEADGRYRRALYPHAFVLTEEELLRRQIQPETHDDRKMKYDLQRLMLLRTSPAERSVVTEEGMA